MVELLGQMVESLESSELGDEPFFIALLCGLESLPGGSNIGDHLALGGDESGSICKSQSSLESVVARFELTLLVGSWGLLVASVVAELVKSSLDVGHLVLNGSVLKGGSSSLDPGEEVRCQSLVLVHELLIGLVDVQDFEDSVGGGLGLEIRLLLEERDRKKDEEKERKLKMRKDRTETQKSCVIKNLRMIHKTIVFFNSNKRNQN